MKNKTLRNILFVVSGTAGAQAVGFAFSPFLTRIYSPDMFGSFGVFLTLVSLITPIATLSYNYAINLPKEHEDSLYLACYCGLLSLIVATIVFVVVIMFGDYISEWLNIDNIVLMILPITVLLSSFVSIFQQVKIRSKQFSLIAKTNFFYSLSNNTLKLVLGWVFPSTLMLAFSMNFSLLMHINLIRVNLMKITFFNLKNKLFLLKYYKDFSLYRTPQILINTYSQNIPVIFLASYYGSASVGYFSLSKMVLSIPISLVGKSVSDVMFPKMAEVKNRGKPIRSLMVKSTLILYILGLFPFLIIIFFSSDIFQVIFGSQWYDAGIYASWMGVWLYFAFANRVCIAAIPILKLQKQFLKYEVISLVTRVASIILPAMYGEDDIHVVASFCIISAFSNIILMIFVMKKSNEEI